MAVVNRWYHILQLLVTRKKVSLTVLQQKLSVSSQTVKNSIVSLNDALQGIAEVVQEENKFQLVIYNFDQFDEVMAGSLKKTSDFNSSDKRISFIIKRLIEADDFVVIDTLSEELGVSRGTAAKDIREMKQMVNLFNVEVNGTPNRGMRIYGNEFDLRLLFIYHVQDYFESCNLTQETLEIIDQLTHDNQVPKLYASLLKKTLETVIARIRTSCLLHKLPDGYINVTKNHKVVEQLMVHLELTYSITLSQVEKDFICFPFNISANRLKVVDEESDNKLQLYFGQMLKQIHQVLVVDLNEDNLFSDMRLHLMYTINRLLFRYPIQDLFYGEVEKNYPFAYELAKVGMHPIEKGLKRTASEVELSYLALYFELDIRRQTDKAIQKEIAIVCSTGKGTALMIQRQIEKIVGSDIKITHYSEEEYEKQDLDQYFAIFTTIPLKNIDPKTPVIQLTNIFNTEGLRNEWQQINKVHANTLKNTLFRYKKLNVKNTYNENLKAMIHDLEIESLVDEQFEQKIFRREEKNTTIYETHFAFPHTMNEASEKVILSFGILPNQTLESMEGNSNISLILLLAIPASITQTQEKELLKVYDFIFAFTTDSQLRKEINQINQLSDLENWIKRRFIR